jgi:hypothetical protein
MRRGLKLVALLVRHDETAINFSQSSGANGVVAEMMKVSKPSSGAWRSATVLMPSAGDWRRIIASELLARQPTTPHALGTAG